ncbi:MAG: Gfo/Idh/MocA family oxidoreductase [Acidobacteriota bacterium]|nr:Gfo/Idh/MocA family oxidoreductase [Blastocatellia bacterium]MDW8413607.1 Gfo/Idh/MocA family oxidoreductase [Acidobacteriota bacterium]
MPIRLAIVGVGNWGYNHLRTFAALQDCDLRLVCDLSEARLKKAKEVAPSVETATDYSKVLSDDIEAVVIATDAASHYEQARCALEAGKAVFVEKPITLEVRQAEELVNLAEKKGLVLMVGHLLLYHPVVVAIKNYLSSGEWGEVFYIYSTRVNLGTIRTTENALWSLAPHDISVMLHLTGKMPRVVNAVGGSFIKKSVQDVVFFSLRFPGNIIGHGQASWLDPHKIRKFTIVSQRKMVVFDDVEPREKLRIYDKGFDEPKEYLTYGEQYTLRDGDIFIPAIKMAEPLRLECQHFLDCVATRKRPLTDGVNGLEVLRILDAAQQSLDNDGTPVILSD